MNRIIQTLKDHPRYADMGMIASHLGVVRGTSLNGKKVRAIDVVFDDDVLGEIIREARQLEGIVEVVVHTAAGHLQVGDDIMAVAVGGDTREHVFPALVAVVNRIKKEATRKKEFY